MKSPIPYTYDLNTKSAQKVICVTHTDDNSVDVIQLHVVQNGALIDFSGNTIIARMVMSRTHELLSDNVVCEIDEVTKDIMIPIDRKAVSTRKGLMLVEVSVRGVLPQKLTFQFPLLVRVNGSILDDAEITPESQGTIPELLKDAADALEEATQALEQAGDYDSLEHKPQINGNTLSGNKTSDELGLQNKLTAGENVNIDANGNITITGVTKYRNVPAEQVDDCIKNGVLYSLYISGLQSNAQIIAHNNYTTITQHALLDDGRLMYRMRQGETPWQPAGEWSAWEEIGGDYNSLSNKPQINSVTLSGNKSSDDLGLQKKLTAGKNITLESDGTISASGGITSYNDLSNLPAFLGFRAPYYEDRVEFKGEFHIPNFTLTLGEDNKYHMALSRVYGNTIVEGSTPFEIFTTALQKAIFKNYEIPDIDSDFFTNSSHAPDKTGLFYINRNNLEGMPVPAFGYLFNYMADRTRLQFYWTSGYNDSIYANRIFFREQYMSGFRSWVELTGGGAQIVSGVVNQNGTITFTDSDGNTFTTTGSSVIGFSPTATVTQTASGATVSITDSTGTTTANISNGADGQDYVLTAQDKSDIADIVLDELQNADTMTFPIASEVNGS